MANENNLIDDTTSIKPTWVREDNRNDHHHDHDIDFSSINADVSSSVNADVSSLVTSSPPTGKSLNQPDSTKPSPPLIQYSKQYVNKNNSTDDYNIDINNNSSSDDSSIIYFNMLHNSSNSSSSPSNNHNNLNLPQFANVTKKNNLHKKTTSGSENLPVYSRTKPSSSATKVSTPVTSSSSRSSIVVGNNETAECIRARRAARRNRRAMSATKNNIIERSFLDDSTNTIDRKKSDETNKTNNTINTKSQGNSDNNYYSQTNTDDKKEIQNYIGGVSENSLLTSFKSVDNEKDVNKSLEDGMKNKPNIDKVTSEEAMVKEIDKNISHQSLKSSKITAEAFKKRAMSQNFIMEHKIFLRAIMQLLHERDQYAIQEADVNDPNSLTMKTGPLKKASIGGVFWKVKYVEIRRGVFSYYEDDVSDHGELLRKSLPLRASQCNCRAVKVRKNSITPPNFNNNNHNSHNNSAKSHYVRHNDNNNIDNTNKNSENSGDEDASRLTTGGAIFELTIGGGPRRLWMANSKEERQAWIRAIYAAMIGGPVIRGDNFFNYQREGKRNNGKKLSKSKIPTKSPYKHDLEKYLAIQKKIIMSSTKEEYMNGLQATYGKSMSVPVEWIKELMNETNSPLKINTKKKRFRNSKGVERSGQKESVSSDVLQLWKDMRRDILSINGDLYNGGTGHGPERTIGGLTQCILNFDKSSPYHDEEVVDNTKNGPKSRGKTKKHRIVESQAITYARDILLASNRTRSGGDSYFCVNSLCKNANLVVICPSSTEAEPLKITVRHSSFDDYQKHSNVLQDPSDLSGWIYMKKLSYKFWKKRFCVLSGDTLSFYKKATPRPHIFRGSLRLKRASIRINTIDETSSNDGNSDSLARQNQILGVLPPVRRTKHGESIISPIQGHDSTYKYTVVSIIMTQDSAQDHQLLFEDQSYFSLWNQYIRSAIDHSNDKDDLQLLPSPTTKNKNNALDDPVSSRQLQSPAHKRSGKIDDYSDDSGGETNDTDEKNDSRGVQPKSRAKYIQSEFNSRGAKKGTPTVEISVQASTVYKICSADPQGDMNEDTWAMLRTNFLQNFRLSGGSNGRMTRGEEIVQLDCLQGLVTDDAFDRSYFKNAEDT